MRPASGAPKVTAPTPLAEHIDDQGARILRTTLVLTALLLAVAIVGGHALGPSDASRMAVRYVMLAVAVTSLVTLQRRGVNAAVRQFLFYGVALMMIQALAVGGLRTPILFGLPAILVLAGWFLGRRQAFALGAAAFAGAGALVLLETEGILQPQARDVYDHWWTMAVVIPISSVIGVHAHARFVRQLQKANDGARRLHLINQLAAQVYEIPDVKRILRVTIDAIVTVTNAPRVVSYLVEPNGGGLRLVASHGFDADYERLAQRIAFDTSWAGAAIEQRCPLVARDIALENRFDPAVRDALLARGLRSGVMIPLVEQSTPLGCVALFYPAGALEDLDTAETESFEAVSRTLSMAIANALHVGHLRHQARHDSLTGLSNRAALHEAFGRLLAAPRPGERPAVLLLDLDRFKDINDTLGHHIGDRLLTALAARLASTVGQRGAITCRLGGDEFAILIEDGVSAEEVLVRARGIRESLAHPFEIGGMTLKVGASIGVAVFPEHGEDSHELLRAADVAMYQAKSHSLGVALYDRGFDDHSPERLALLNDLTNALTRGELVMHYQPKLDLRSGGIAGFEALVRWRHPKLGLLAPASFIGLAEASEVIHPFTRVVLDLAMRDCAKLRRAGLYQPIALNLSPRNLIDDRCVRDIEHLLREHGLHYEDIELEITETAIMHDPEQVAGLLDYLDSRGVGLAIDDFGTGYSSLAHLKRLPLGFLKVDRVFVSNMRADEQDAIIVRSTIALAHSLGMQVIAEGVEDAPTAELLRAMGCDIIQGYHLSPPLPLDELVGWMAMRDVSLEAQGA